MAENESPVSSWFLRSGWLRNRYVVERQIRTSNRQTFNMKVVENDWIYLLTKGIWISWNEREWIEDSLCLTWHLAIRNYPCTVDEKMWDWSGLKYLDEIYNFHVEAEAIWGSFGGQNNELSFVALRFREEQKENESATWWRIYIGHRSVEKMGLEVRNAWNKRT
jgi:hypothetical protein